MEQIHFHIGVQHSKDTNTVGMTRDDETRLTVPRGTGDRDMSITGRLHRHGRLRESRSSESDVERSLTVQDTMRKMGSTSEYMAKCKYKLVTHTVRM